MFGIIPEWWYFVDVDVKNTRLRHDAGQTDLFLHLSQSNPSQIGVAVGVPSGLEPFIQLPMVKQQDRSVFLRDNPRRCGKMSRKDVPVQDRRPIGQEIEKRRNDTAFFRVVFRICP